LSEMTKFSKKKTFFQRTKILWRKNLCIFYNNLF
jgi:hypothetical protein